MKKRPRLGKLFDRFPNLTELQRVELCRRRIGKTLKPTSYAELVHVDQHDASFAFGYAFNQDQSKRPHTWRFKVKGGRLYLNCEDCDKVLEFNLSGSLINRLAKLVERR